jgi:hypothetical protein
MSTLTATTSAPLQLEGVNKFPKTAAPKKKKTMGQRLMGSKDKY